MIKFFRACFVLSLWCGPMVSNALAFEPDGVAASFRPSQAPLPVPPPHNAIVLLGLVGQPPKFVGMSGRPIDWPLGDAGSEAPPEGFANRLATLEVKATPGHANHIVSDLLFQDADIHAEFMVSPTSQGNSGLYLHGHYEMQIYDSAGADPPTDQDEGSLYRFAAPLVNAARPVGQWQVYDIRFRAPRHDVAGHLLKAGSITAWLNGKLVQDGIAFTKPRSPYTPYNHGVTDFSRGIEKRLIETCKGPLFLQDHGSPTRFRNVWLVPLDE